jgi:hypothetical protein
LDLPVTVAFSQTRPWKSRSAKTANCKQTQAIAEEIISVASATGTSAILPAWKASMTMLAGQFNLINFYG